MENQSIYLSLYHNSKHHIYLPKNSNNPGTLGEEWFFAGRFWKLQVMYGLWWMDTWNTKRGFSLFNVRAAKRVKELTDWLDSLGIEYKTDISEAGWQYRVNISAKKRNLELIDKLYEKFYKETLKNHKGWFIYENELMDEFVKSEPELHYSDEPESKFKRV